ncbi:hypothetical protein K466DRAFT_581435 [Polyporus arcularius HHB13444]|uniref:Uncharacterized protein n=1 Tax=Polyporus arcularius HHB13444 TaxID=1314778 RepID=A0A5C3Q3F6_9APHY|nr:hypothetical protein K466DRAFT_581435 [Polyporus arcularius HHB13444]
MPLLGKSDTFSENPDVREVEKVVAKEARTDQKNLDHAITDLSHADKSHNKSIKAANKAAHALDKAVAKEHKAAKAVNKAVHNHEVAVANEQNAEKVIQIKKQHEARLEQDLEQKKQHLDALRQRKEHNDQVREAKLADIHAGEPAPPEARSSYNAGDRASIADSVGTSGTANTSSTDVGGTQA